MELGTALAGAWSSGISMYFVAALLGIAGRLDWITAPDLLTEPWVIALALVLFACEFVVDKVAWLDSVWDGVHTVLRPAAGAWLLTTVEGEPTHPAVLAIAGGLMAFSAHAAKASTRAAVNTSPEPASNVVVSLAEDGIVAGVMAFALAFPVIAGVLAVVLAVASGLAAFVMYRLARRAARALRRRRRSPDPGTVP